MGRNAPEEREVGGGTQDFVVCERSPEAADRRRTIRGVDDQLREHRVVIYRDLIPDLEPGVVAYARTLRRREGFEEPARGHPLLVLGIDAGLDGAAPQGHFLLGEWERFPRCDGELEVDEVEASNELRHGVFDLQARVHLQEVELVIVEEKLHRACVVVAGLAGEADGGVADRVAEVLIERWGRGFFDDLLVAALDRTLPLEEMEDVGLPVSNHLHLHVARVFQKFLEEHRPVSKGSLGLPARSPYRLDELTLARHCPHAPSSTSRACLYQNRVSDAISLFREPLLALVFSVVAWDSRHAGAASQFFGPHLVADRLHRPGRGPDPGCTCRLDRPGEFRAL